MKTAVIYARYSSDSQTEQSIDGQLRVCTEYAKAHDILVLNTYIDRGMTGTNDNRPDFQRMIKDSSRKEWNYVLVYKLDRFSRNKYETAIHKKTLRDNGVKVLSAMENIPDTPEGIILESLLEGMNQYFSAELAQKVKRGMRETRLKGLFQGGGLPYGYRVEQRKVVVDENTAEVVRYIYDQYAKGVYVKDIINALTAKGILYKGKPFARNTVYGILKNEKYSGVYKHDDEIVDNIYTQIVPSETFATVRKMVEANRYGKRSTATVYLLRNKLICGYCGKPISAESGTSYNGEVKRYYKCIGRKLYHNNCEKTPLPKDDVEQFIVNAVIAELNNPQTIDYIINEIMRLQGDIETTTLKILVNEKNKVNKALENIVNAIENGIISNTTNKRLHELEKQQEDLERQIIVERSRCAVKLSKTDIREYYEQALRLEPQMLINYLIKQIVLYNDKVEIHFNSPLRTSPESPDNRGFFLCSKNAELNNKHETNIRLELYVL